MLKTDKVIYHTKLQVEYNWLMEQLEEAGCIWASKDSPTKGQFYYKYLSATCIWVYDRIITCGDYGYYKNNSQEYNGWAFVEVSDLM